MPPGLPQMFLFGGVVPALIAAATLLAALRTRRPSAPAAGRWGAALGAGLAFVAGSYLLELAPWSPTVSYEWIPYAAVVVALVEMLVVSVAPTETVAWVDRCAAAVLAAWFLVPPLAHVQEQLLTWRIAATVAMMAGWILVSAAGKRVSGARLPVLLGVLSLAAALVIELAGFNTLATASGVLAAACFGAALVAWRRPQAEITCGLAGPFAVVLTALIINTHFYSGGEVPWQCLALVLAAPSLLGVAALTLARIPDITGWRQAGLLAVAGLAPAAVAIAWALLAEAPEEEASNGPERGATPVMLRVERFSSLPYGNGICPFAV